MYISSFTLNHVMYACCFYVMHVVFGVIGKGPILSLRHEDMLRRPLLISANIHIWNQTCSHTLPKTTNTYKWNAITCNWHTLHQTTEKHTVKWGHIHSWKCSSHILIWNKTHSHTVLKTTHIQVTFFYIHSWKALTKIGTPFT